MTKIRTLLLLTAALASGASAQTRPDTFAPARAIVADLQKIVTPNGVQDSYAAEIGGIKQWVTVRGSNRANPIILFLHGGPAAPETPEAWSFQRPWEDFFTVVQWDQRAAGKTYALSDPKKVGPTLSVERYRDDAIELIEQLRAKYGKRKVILLGHSWGTVVGMAVAEKRPDLLYAYIGAGQIIDFREGERVGYEHIVATAQKDGNAKAVAELEALRPYPRPGVPLDVDAVAMQRKWSIHYGFLTAGRDNARYYFDVPKLSPEYTPADLKAWDDSSDFTIPIMLPKLGDVSFARIDRLKVPTFMFVGRHDYTTPSEVTAAWVGKLRAPKKGVVWFENSAHLMMVEEPGHFLKALLDTVQPLARD